MRDEVTSLESINDLSKLELLANALPARVGSPLSINALREDLQVSHQTVASWLDVLERLYAIFRAPPFGAPRLRAVKKEQKHYHFDWTIVGDPAPVSRTWLHRTCSNGPIISWTRRGERSNCATSATLTAVRSTSS